MSADPNRLEYIAEIAKLYFESGMTIAQIAEAKQITLDEVGSLLEEARRQNMVSVQYKRPLPTDKLLEDELVSIFNLKAAKVLVRGSRSYNEVLQDLGALGAQYFESELKPNSIIGISWGSALYHLINSIRPRSLPDAEVVQLIGAMGNENNPTDGPILAQLLANRLGSRIRYLHAPLLVERGDSAEALRRERSIRETLQHAEKVTIGLVGIGTVDPEFNSLLRAGYLTKEELQEVERQGAVGDVCAQYFDAEGRWLNIDINHRVIGISADVVRRIPTLIGVAAGDKKVKPILAALKGQFVNVLVTDDVTAQAILDQYRHKEEKKAVEPKIESLVPLISLKGIWKVFSGVPVLRGVDIELYPGEIHALLGGNGSGKSTLMKIVSGVYQPDAGVITLDGSPVSINDPADGHLKGIYLVPQEPKLFPHLSVLENLLIGSDIQYEQIRDKLSRLIDLLHFEASLNEPAGTLNIANQQILEILRGLIRDVRILILDEPTSALTFREVELLFKRMRLLRDEGIGIFFISHRLNEILEISDRVSVLRDGNLVLSAKTASLNSRALIQAMLPEESEENGGGFEKLEGKKALKTNKVLEVKDFRGEMFEGINLYVNEGEIVGLAGVVGAGRTELARSLVGLEPNTKGNLFVDGKQVLHRSPTECRNYGLVYMPEDRHAHGVFLDRPSIETMSCTILERLGRLFINVKREEEMGNRFVEQFRIHLRNLGQVTRTLSGGNQQKVLLSKTLASRPRVVVLDEPTRGIDVKARRDVYRIIQSLTQEGIGVLLISSDLEEIVQWCDRIYVMYQGRIVKELSHHECNMERVMAASFGIVE